MRRKRLKLPHLHGQGENLCQGKSAGVLFELCIAT